MTQDINKCALITASSKGLGRAIATIFAQNNHDIILHGRDVHKIKETKERLQQYGINVYEVSGDLREKETIANLYEISRNKISVLVNNAAIPCYGIPIQEMSLEQVMNSLNTNLVSPIKLTHKIYPIFLQQGHGSIININSIVGIEPKRFRSVHSATKWGLKGFTKSLNIESQENNINVINVYPTRIKTVTEFTYGLEPLDVAQEIYQEYAHGEADGELVIDGRPKEFRGKQ